VDFGCTSVRRGNDIRHIYRFIPPDLPLVVYPVKNTLRMATMLYALSEAVILPPN